MTGQFKVKFVSKRTKGFRGQSGDAGNMDRMPWKLIVEEIAKQGIQSVEYVRHDDSEPTNKKQLDGKEMLALWKSVEKKQHPN